MRKIFVDTGGWYAAAASRDRDHEAAKQFLAANHLPLVTSDYVMDETVTLLQSRLGHIYAVKFLDALQAYFPAFAITQYMNAHRTAVLLQLFPS